MKYFSRRFYAILRSPTVMRTTPSYTRTGHVPERIQRHSPPTIYTHSPNSIRKTEERIHNQQLFSPVNSMTRSTLPAIGQLYSENCKISITKIRQTNYRYGKKRDDIRRIDGPDREDPRPLPQRRDGRGQPRRRGQTCHGA